MKAVEKNSPILQVKSTECEALTIISNGITLVNARSIPSFKGWYLESSLNENESTLYDKLTV